MRYGSGCGATMRGLVAVSAAILLQAVSVDRALAWGAGGGSGGPSQKQAEQQQQVPADIRDKLRRFKDLSKRYRAEKRLGQAPTGKVLDELLKLFDELKPYKSDPDYVQAEHNIQDARALPSGTPTPATSPLF